MKSYVLISSVLMFISLNLMAASNVEIKYYGQGSEQLELDTIKDETRYNYRDIDTTCTRQIPHTSEVCGYERYYRQGPCHWESGNETCRTVGGGRDCRYVGGRTSCRTNSSGREVCRDLPGHQVCESKPGRRVCSTSAGRNVCPQVSYREYECHDETIYTSESYACVQTIKEPYIIKRQVNAAVELNFKSLDIEAPKFLVNVLLEQSGVIKLTAKNTASESALMFAKVDAEVNDAGDDEITVNAKISARVVDKKTFLAPITKGIKKVRLDSKGISFMVGKIRNKKMITVKMVIIKKGFIGIGRQKVINKTLKISDFIASEVSGMSKLVLDSSKFTSIPKSGKKYAVSIELQMSPGPELITPVTGKLKTSYSQKIKAK